MYNITLTSAVVWFVVWMIYEMLFLNHAFTQKS